MGKLMCQQMLAGLAVRLILALGKIDIAPQGEGAGVDLPGGRVGGAVGVNAHIAEGPSEAGFHALHDRRGQRVAARLLRAGKRYVEGGGRIAAAGSVALDGRGLFGAAVFALLGLALDARIVFMIARQFAGMGVQGSRAACRALKLPSGLFVVTLGFRSRRALDLLVVSPL